VDAIVPIINRYKIPVIGSDLTNNTWFTNPLMFPQGAPQQAVSYGFVNAAMNYFKTPNMGVLWCIEVPRACEQSNRAIGELAPKLGATVKKSIQVSITAPSYVQQCLEFKNAGVQVIAMPIDAATVNRFARSCTQVGFTPKVMPHPVGSGNEKQLLSGNKWLGNGYIPLNVFPWMGNSTPAEKYYQAAVKKYNPGFTTGGAASLGWSAGAMLLAASAGLSAENPTTQQFLDGLYTFKGQKFTELGGLTGPRTFTAGANPKVPYCLFGAVTNDTATGWKQSIDKPNCTDLIAPSDPQAAG
jgi:ABC-type branched-subunit amino acid transport system substrate-binding protein